jgi:hypothetical protein
VSFLRLLPLSNFPSVFCVVLIFFGCFVLPTDGCCWCCSAWTAIDMVGCQEVPAKAVLPWWTTRLEESGAE